jgi:acyl-CoA synthetase (AMP-forming)/AMP-acid ligase II
MRVEKVYSAMAVDGLGTALMHEHVFVHSGCDAELRAQVVLAHCREQLADFKIPQYIVVSGRPLPRNPSGKLLKAQLRKSVEWGAPL